MKSAVAAIRFILFFLWSVLLAPAQALLLLFRNDSCAYIIPGLWHRGICRIFGIKVIVEGKPETGKKTMFVSNHLSYLDIPVIGANLKASFVAKKEVAGWPVFGFLARLQQTAFIDRRPQSASSGKNTVYSMLESGKSIILFPEGTSSDGKEVLPFKSSLFSVAGDMEKNNEKRAIQPFTIIQENTSNQEDRDLYCWYGEMELLPHLWSFAKSRGVTIRLVFHPALETFRFDGRKALCRACFKSVNYGLAYKKICKPMLDTDDHKATLAS